MSDNHYDVLGVEPSASRDELRDAYRARVDDLTAARERKGITESQLQDNRDEVAKVRSAWNVLSDPFQRQRYDSQVESGAVEVVDDDGADAEPAVQLTGWRRLMAPPPPKAATGSRGNGKQPPPARPVRQPTIPLPPGTSIAQPKVRGMAFLFDLAVVLLLMFTVNAVLPAQIQSNFLDKQKQIQSLSDASDAQGKINDAKSSESTANKNIAKAQSNGNQSDLKSAQSDLKSAQSDLKSANSDFTKAQKDFNSHQKSMGLEAVSLPHDTKKLDDMAKQLADDIWGTQVIVAVVILVVALLYLVPVTLRTGATFAMRSRKIKVVRTDGSRAGFVPVTLRFGAPLLLGLAGSASRVPLLAALLPIAALGMVLWGYRDANGQGLHDKLAGTLVVDA
jgi:curved DNA-binding protein CbpA